ncbi:phage integrase family protein [Providencia burhodogranariea DSM 19968]|uniref:Phage integrase family protein n=2 Tax=Providencia burhodogranariea TaxID=516074 RepID=K8W3N8_9GAMM|nr:phage integrase family protein [Providencia burhodogranariea DSM 19968]
MAIPAELKSVLGKGELKRSLKTKDLAEAKHKAPAIIALMQAEIESARKIFKGEQSVTDDDIERIASLWLTSILSRPELIQERYLFDYPYGLDLTFEGKAIATYLEQNGSTRTSYNAHAGLLAELSDSEPPLAYIEQDQRDIKILQLVKNELTESLELLPIELPPSWKIRLAWRLADYRNQAAEMLMEDIVPKYKATEIQEKPKAPISFSELFDEYQEQIRRDEPNRAENRIKEYTPAANRFSAFIGLKPIEEISKEDILKFRSLMEMQPLRPTKATKKSR